MKKKGYVLVRYENGLVEPALICSDRYLKVGDEVIVGSGDTGIVVSDIDGYLHPEESIGKIAEIFEANPNELPKVIGQIHKDYWEEAQDGDQGLE